MDTIIIFTFATLFLITYTKYKSLSAPVVIFNLLWFVLVSISKLGNMSLYPPSDKVLTIFLFGGLFFNLGSLLNRKIKHNENNYIINGFQFNKKVNKWILYIEVCLLIYYLNKTVDVLRYLAAGNTYEAIRSFYFSSDNFTSVFEELFVMFFADPIVLLSSILVAIGIFKQLLSKGCMTIMIINIVIRTFISGGRTAIFELGVILIVTIIFFGLKSKEMKQKALKSACLFSLLLFLGAFVSIQRHGDEGSYVEVAINNVVEYFTGSFSFFDMLLKDDEIPEMTYGLTTLGGITDIFIHILRFCGFTEVKLSYINVGSVLADFKEIGPNKYYNAMPTMYYYFYTDFREIGIFLFSTLFGYISTKSYNRLLIKKDAYSFIFYMLILILVIESSFNWQFERIHYFMAFIFSYFIFYKKRYV